MPDLDDPEDWEARAFAAEAALDAITDWILAEMPEASCCDRCAGYATALDDILAGDDDRGGPHYTHVQTITFAPEYEEAL